MVDVAALQEHLLRAFGMDGRGQYAHTPNSPHDLRRELLTARAEIKRCYENVQDARDVSAIQDALNTKLLEGMQSHLLAESSFAHPRGVHDLAEAIWQGETLVALDPTTSQHLRNNPHWTRRAWVAMLCAEYHHYVGKDRGAALWWAALGYIADVLVSESHENNSGNENVLRYMLGVPDSTITLLREHARKIREGTFKDDDDGLLRRTPESVLVDVLRDPKALPLIGPSVEYSYPTCRAFVAAARRVVVADDAHRAEWLERLVMYLFATIPGMRPHRDVMTMDRSGEVDLVVLRLADNAYHVPVRGGRWLAECKSTPADNIDAEHVGHFLAKMTFHRADFGVLVANVAGDEPDGKTDDRIATYGLALLRGHDRSSDRPCVAVRLSELERIEKGELSFRDLLSETFDVMRFGRQRGRK